MLNLQQIEEYVELSKQQRHSVSETLRQAREKIDDAVTDLVHVIHQWKQESILLGKITEILADSYIRVDPTGRIIDFNDAACKLFDTNQDFIIGKNVNILFLEEWKNFLSKGRFFEQQVQTVSSKILTVSTSLTETAYDYVFLIREVNPHQRKEADIRIIAQALDTSSDVILVTDNKNRIVFTNKAFTVHTGYSKEEALGKNPGFMKSSNNPHYLYEEMWAALKNKKAWSGTLFNIAKDGKVLEDYTVITPVMNEDSDLPAYYVSVKRVLHKTPAPTNLEFKL